MSKQVIKTTLDGSMVVSIDSRTNATYSFDASVGVQTIDNGIAFYVSQLASIESRIYETKYGKIRFQEFVPVVTTDPDEINQVDYFHYNAVTVGKFIGANAADLPQSDIEGGRSTIPVFYGGNAYGYSLDELRVSQAQRIPLDTTKATASYRGFQEHAQKVAYFGDAARGITGLFNNANVAVSNSAVNWDTATGLEIVADLNSFLTDVWRNSAEVHVPDTLLLPSDRWSKINSMRMADGTDTTVLQYFMLNNVYRGLTGGTLTIQPVLQLEDIGTNSQGRMMAYELNDENLTMRMPIVWRSQPPQAKGLRMEVPCEYKFGGVAFRYPGSAAYRDFINT